MIKFRCGHCNQKLGVPDEWGGKRIRCNHCKESCEVPHPQIELQTVSQSAPVSPATDFPMPEGESDGGGFSSDLLNLEAGTPLPREERHAPIVPKTKAAIPEYRISRGDAGEGPSQTMAMAKGLGKIPVSIGLAFACGIGVAAIWGGVAVATGFSFNYFAVGVACAAAWGLVVLQENRNVGLGLLGAFIGLVGIFCGKYFVAKWAVMPGLQTYLDKEMEEMEPQTLSSDQMNKLLQDPDVVYKVVCMQLAENGEFSREAAEEIVLKKFWGKEAAEPSPEVVTAQDKIDTALKEWNSDQKVEAIRNQYGRLAKLVIDKFRDSKIGSAVTVTMAFVATFSLFDLLWFPMALWAAFKIGNGNDT